MAGGFVGARGCAGSSDDNYQTISMNSDNYWRPRILVNSAESQIDPELKAKFERDELLRRVRGILNKLTTENFVPLEEEFLKLKVDTIEETEAVASFIVEKAVDEPYFVMLYVILCHRVIMEVKEGSGIMKSDDKTFCKFRNALLDKLEREFKQKVTQSSVKEEKLKPIHEKINNCKDSNEKLELEALLDEEKRNIRRRSILTVCFIGELFNMRILTGRIINTCIESLLKDPNNEDMLECLCKLLTTVGQKFEQTDTPTFNKTKYSLDSVILRMQNIVSKNENSQISSRVRFMLLDVIDLRKNKWLSTRNEAPNSIEALLKVFNNLQLSNSFISAPGGRRRSERPSYRNRYNNRRSNRANREMESSEQFN